MQTKTNILFANYNGMEVWREPIAASGRMEVEAAYNTEYGVTTLTIDGKLFLIPGGGSVTIQEAA